MDANRPARQCLAPGVAVASDRHGRGARRPASRLVVEARSHRHALHDSWWK